VRLSPPHIRLHTRAAAGGERKVSWLELFFDLVFVAAVAQVAEPLREHYTLGELTRFAPLFLLIWWAWTGRAVFSTRFEPDDLVHRALTMVEMFAVAVMAANARDSLASRSSAGFAAAYAGVRIILLVHYWRATALREARELSVLYLAGHGMAAVLWLLSSVVPLNLRLALWLVAFLMDLGTPWLTVDRSVHLPPHPSHLPERFGLFTLILLGESVVAVMKGIESQETWSPLAAAAAFSGVAALFGIWWWYFEGLKAAAERAVRSRSRCGAPAHLELRALSVLSGHRHHRCWPPTRGDTRHARAVAVWRVADVGGRCDLARRSGDGAAEPLPSRFGRAGSTLV
jgi:low temperature requirement protein LtrA